MAGGDDEGDEIGNSDYLQVGANPTRGRDGANVEQQGLFKVGQTAGYTAGVFLYMDVRSHVANPADARAQLETRDS